MMLRDWSPPLMGVPYFRFHANNALGLLEIVGVGHGLSEKTVEFHKHHIMESFNLKSNAELVLFALKLGLISINPEASPHTNQTS